MVKIIPTLADLSTCSCVSTCAYPVTCPPNYVAILHDSPSPLRYIQIQNMWQNLTLSWDILGHVDKKF